MHTHINACFLHYTLSSFNLLLAQCSEKIMNFPAALLLLVLPCRHITRTGSRCRLWQQCFYQINTARVVRQQLLCLEHNCQIPYFCVCVNIPPGLSAYLCSVSNLIYSKSINVLNESISHLIYKMTNIMTSLQ